MPPFETGKTLQVRAIFAPQVATAVTVTPSVAQLTEVGGSVTFTGSVADQVGGTMSADDLQWTSSEPAVATVTPTGASSVATAVGVGSATITATTPNGGSATASLSVDLPPVGTDPLVIFSDMEDGSAWSATLRIPGSGTSSVESHPTSGGVEGAYRRIEHVFPGAGETNVFHGYTARTYDPSTEGAIVSLSFSEYRIKLQPLGSGSIGATFALEQGGQIYYLPGNAWSDETWTRFEASDLTATSFSPAPGPDFSASGGPITFGFIRSNTRNSVSALTLISGTDSFRVEMIR